MELVNPILWSVILLLILVLYRTLPFLQLVDVTLLLELVNGNLKFVSLLLVSTKYVTLRLVSVKMFKLQAVVHFALVLMISVPKPFVIPRIYAKLLK
jgi:hypothetical protein